MLPTPPPLNGHASTRRFQSGDTVRLLTPENPRLNGSLAVIVQATEWGAHVQTTSAATGQFRALHEEMVLALESPALILHAVAPDSDTVVEDYASLPDGFQPVAFSTTAAQEQRMIPAEEMGYTGDFCSTCGSSRVRRAGKCAVCEDCGTPTGCS